MFVKINKNLYFLQGTNGGRHPYANSLLIDDEITAIVDTGADEEDLAKVAEEYKPEMVINTHFHIDHTRGNCFFPKTKMIAHSWDAQVLSSGESFIQATGLAQFDTEALQYFFPGELPTNFSVEGSLVDGQILDFGATQFQVIHTPGHTPGHCALYCEKEGILFTGDVDLTSFGPWYGNPDANVEDFRRSIEKLLEIEAKMVLTGHQEPVTEGIKKRFVKYLNTIDRRDELLLDFLQDPKTMEEIVDAKLIYRKHPEPVEIYRYFEEAMVSKHLQGLMAKGAVVLEGEQYRISI